MERSYSARKQFLADVENSLTGFTTRHAYSGYGRNRAENPGVQVKPRDIVKFMQRANKNAIAVSIEREYVGVDSQTLLIKVTTKTYKIENEPDNRWRRYNTDDSVKENMKAAEPNTAERYFLVRLPAKMKHKTDEGQLLLGPKGNCEQARNVRTGVTEFKLSDKKKIKCVELKGKNATLWVNRDAEEINHLVNQLEGTYASPQFKSNGFEIEIEGEALEIGKNLKLYKLTDENVPSGEGKLLSCLTTSKLVITAAFGHGSSLTYRDGGKTVSKDIAPGTYLVDAKRQVMDAYSYRAIVLSSAEKIDVESESDRMDFISLVDVSDSDAPSDELFWESRIDEGASILIDDSISTSDDFLDRL